MSEWTPMQCLYNYGISTFLFNVFPRIYSKSSAIYFSVLNFDDNVGELFSKKTFFNC